MTYVGYRSRLVSKNEMVHNMKETEGGGLRNQQAAEFTMKALAGMLMSSGWEDSDRMTGGIILVLEDAIAALRRGQKTREGHR